MFQGKRLTVAHPGPEYMLATKVIAGRPKDVTDIAVLIGTTGYDSVERLRALVAEVYGPSTPATSAVRDRDDQALRYYRER